MLDRTFIRLTKLVCSVERTIDSERNHGMPDLIHSTKHSWHSLRLRTLTQALANARIGGGGHCAILLTFLEIFSRLLGYVTPIWSLMKRAGDPTARAISLRVLLP
jgi:hypothetical protein